MKLTLLIDLDDTLLDSKFETFLPEYFKSLSHYLAKHVSPSSLLSALISGTKLMYENEDPSLTLQKVFEDYFYPQLDLQKEDITSAIERYYNEIFPTLGKYTKPLEEARALIDWAFSAGHRIAIATDPVFPRTATIQRLEWAGVNPETFEVISTFEDFHFTKQHPSYYAELLGYLGWPDDPILMIGNDLEKDIDSAQRLGLCTYHISDEGDTSYSKNAREKKGPLKSVQPWLETIDVATLTPRFLCVEAQMALLAATPAVLTTLSKSLDDTDWRFEPKPGDWSFTEIMCHLRDVEREINQMQIRVFDEQENPFIPRPDAAVWARQRDYLAENGLKALSEFSPARKDTMNLLKKLPTRSWTRKAKHAIFGPTNFLETVGFMTEHDRLHIHQAKETLQIICV